MFNFLTPIKGYLIIGAVVAVLAALTYGADKFYKAGVDAEKARWTARENKELTAANAEITRLTAEATTKHAEHEAKLAFIATNHQKEIADNAKRKQMDIDRAVSGALVLRFRADCKRANPDTGSEAGASAGFGDGAATVELPRALTSNLLSLANDADAIADQLRAAQAVIAEDRRLCGAVQ